MVQAGPVTIVAEVDSIIGHRLSDELQDLLKRAFRVIDRIPELDHDVWRWGLSGALKDLAAREKDPALALEMKQVIGGLASYFRLPDPNHPDISHGVTFLDIADDRLSARLTLMPPRGEGNVPTLNTVKEALVNARVIHAVDEDVIDRALKVVREGGDIVWKVVVARGDAAKAPPPRRISFSAPVLDKVTLRERVGDMKAALSTEWPPMKESQRIGFLLEPEPGRPGRDVCGKLIPPPPVNAPDFGEDVVCGPDGVLTARIAGYPLVDGARVEVVPVYFVQASAARLTQDISVGGAVLVKGDLRGPIRIECDDLFVIGNIEEATVLARGDVFAAGGVVGHHKTTIDADGGVYCSFISEARLLALGPIMVTNAIINAEVTSSDRIRVLSNKGMIAGGILTALRGVASATVGSEFGMFTEIVAGTDFFSDVRLGELSRRIGKYEGDLARIEALKMEIARSRVSVENLPPDKQEIYIGVLRKEQALRTELRSLLRRKRTLEERLRKFLEAGVEVAGSVYPPSRVQIMDGIREITEKLEAVSFKYSHGEVVTLDCANNAGQGDNS